MDENIKKLQESVDSIAQTTAYILENMATKDDIKNMATKDDIKNMATKDDIKNMSTKSDIFEVKTEIQDLRLDLKSFRKDTEYSMGELKKDMDDNTESIMHLDKRMEKLEDKVFT